VVLRPGDDMTTSDGSEGREPRSPQIGQLVPAAVGALAILIVFALRGTAATPSPLAIFATVALVVAVIFGAAGALPNRMGVSKRIASWDVAVRTGYLALAAAALYVIQEIVVIRLGDSAVARSDQLLALELLGLLVIALFVARLGLPGTRRQRLAIRGSLSPLANARGVLYGLLAILIVLFFALVAFATAPGSTGTPAVGTGLAVSGAALAFGALLGLLFGIPRSMQGSTGTPDGGAGGGSRYKSNTNLEEISDWLTKIIVGVSLTQFGELQTRALALVATVAKGFGGSDAAQAFAAGLLTTASVSGFLASYLVTRLYLRRALDEADRVEIVEQAKVAAKEAAKEVAGAASASQADQSQADTDANRLATRQLDVGSPEVPMAELAGAIKSASTEARTYILGIAQQQRSKYWASNKPGVAAGSGGGPTPADIVKMERTIPVFEALIEADPTMHQVHGQLGFALKDKTEPDYARAIEELSKAIKLCNKDDEEGSSFYEFNRAIARMRVEPIEPNAASEIQDDLCVAAENDFILEIIKKDAEITDWLKKQSIDPLKLREHCTARGTEEPEG
jgi:hypothetical protein